MTATIRTITLGIGDPHPLPVATLARAAAFLRTAQAEAEAAGYTVQTTRIATRPLLSDMPSADTKTLVTYAATLQAFCADANVQYCSLGPIPADDPALPLDRLSLVPELLLPHSALHATIQVASLAHGIRHDALEPAAAVIADLGTQADGMASFRFAVLACCDAGGPFFPQAYAQGPEWRVAVGLQSADVVTTAIDALAAQVGMGMATLAALPGAVSAVLTATAQPVCALVQRLSQAAGFSFGGIDLSPAPMGEASIAAAIEAVGLGTFGTAGTLSICAALTHAIKLTPLSLCGYSGLMLPVLEDALLGQRCAALRLTAHDLLAYSAVCGTGLDTVPLPGATPASQIAALLADVATLATRLRKPLSARLFLVPGGEAGASTHFTSPYLTNTAILAV